MPLQRHTIYAAGVAAALVTLVALAIANFVGGEADEQGGGREFVISAAIGLAVAAALFGWYIPRAGRAAGGGLVTSVLALASVAVFWSGLPFVLGAAGAVLGWTGRARGEKPVVATAALLVGVLAFLLGGIAVVIDQV